MPPEVDFLVTLLPAQSESVNVFTAWAWLWKVNFMTYLGLPRRYLPSLFAFSISDCLGSPMSLITSLVA